MRIGEIIKKYREEHDLSMRSFAKLAGISASYISKLEKDEDNSGSVTLPKLQSIADAMAVTLDSLMREMDDTVVVAEPKAADPVSRLRYAPVFNPISCGTGKWVDEEPDDMVGLPAFMTRRNLTYFANPADGDSMEPRIHAGDCVVFEQTDVLQSGEIGSFSLNGEYYCKRFRQLADGSYWLFSENPEYEPIPIRPDDDFRVLGKYVLRLTKQ